MSDNDREYPWSRKGEAYDEMFSEGPFDEEEEFDPEEADQRITQFVSSADELSPVLPLRNSLSRWLRSCEQHCATSKRSWRGSPTTRYSPHNCCWASELADCSSTTQNSGRSTQRPHYLVGLLSVALRAEQNTVSGISIQRHNM
jgi:hypothetical protein